MLPQCVTQLGSRCMKKKKGCGGSSRQDFHGNLSHPRVLGAKVFKASKWDYPTVQRLHRPVYLLSPGLFHFSYHKNEARFYKCTYTHAYFILLLNHLRLNCRLCTFHPLSAYVSRARMFSFITTVQLSHSRKLTLMSYYFLAYSPHSNFFNIPVTFPTAVFFPINPGFNSESCIVFNCHISWASFSLEHFPSLISHDTDIFEKLLYRIILNLGLSVSS